MATDSLTGQLLLLAGPSSSGKTTLGLALIDVLGDWLFWEIDEAGPKLPRAMLIEPGEVTHLSAVALAVALERQSRLVEASVTAVAAYVRGGFNVIAEMDLWDEERLAIASRVWEGLRPLLVELRCPIPVLEDRERKRGTVYIGTARAQAERPSWMVPNGLVLDSNEPTTRLVEQVVAWLNNDPKTNWPVAKNSNMKLLPYDPAWALAFEQEKEALLPIFGEALIEIAHIGSTAVPGLTSKPLIDIAVQIRRKKEAESFTVPLSKMGYEFHSSSSERRFFQKGQPTQFHLSIGYADFGGYLERQLVFRDFLRNNPSAREEYQKLKEALLENDPTGGIDYIRGKSEFILRSLESAGFKE